MGKREVSILDAAAISVSEIAWFIENKGLIQTAKRFVVDAYDFFATLSDTLVTQTMQLSSMERTWIQMCPLQKKVYRCF